MEHLDFIVWMVAFPISVSVCRYIDGKSTPKEEFTGGVQAASALIVINIWAYVGYLLFQ